MTKTTGNRTVRGSSRANDLPHDEILKRIAATDQFISAKEWDKAVEIISQLLDSIKNTPADSTTSEYAPVSIT